MLRLPPWLRIEQRGSVALLKAIPESLRIVYVDDILMVGARSVTDAASATIQNRWSTSAPEYAVMGGGSMRFLGIEIQRREDGSYFLHQECYAWEIIDRHPGTSTTQFVKAPEESEQEEAVSLPKVREAQKITGELLRPDLAWAVMKMAQNAVKRPCWTIELGKAVLAYVRHTLNFGLHYTNGVPEDMSRIFEEGNLVMQVPSKSWWMPLFLQVTATVCPALSSSWRGAQCSGSQRSKL